MNKKILDSLCDLENVSQRFACRVNITFYYMDKK